MYSLFTFQSDAERGLYPIATFEDFHDAVDVAHFFSEREGDKYAYDVVDRRNATRARYIAGKVAAI